MNNIVNLSDYKLKQDMERYGLTSSDLINIADNFINQTRRNYFKIFYCGKSLFLHGKRWNIISTNKSKELSLVV